MTTLTSDELLAQVTQEMISLYDSGAVMRLDIPPATAFGIVAMCQLALRHPAISVTSFADLVHDFIEYVEGKFRPYAPSIAEAILRGGDPQYDIPSTPQESLQQQLDAANQRIAELTHRLNAVNQMETEAVCRAEAAERKLATEAARSGGK